MHDDDEIVPICYRCGSITPLLGHRTQKIANGDKCVNCGHPFIRCCINFDILPLIEFVPADSHTDDEAVEWIRSIKVGKKNSGEDNNDMFGIEVNRSLESQQGASEYRPVRLGEHVLKSLCRDDIFACWPLVPDGRVRFFKNMIPDIAISLCQRTHRFFHEEDYEFSFLRDGFCPISRAKGIGSVSKTGCCVLHCFS